MMKALKRLATMLLIAGMALTVGVPTRPRIAYAATLSPVGCTISSVTMALNVIAPSPAHFGDTVTFQAAISNLFPGSCDLSNMTLTITTPDGVAHVKATNLEVPFGSTTPWYNETYVISAADVQNNKATATASGSGIAHNGGDEPVEGSVTKSVSVPPSISVLSVCTLGATATDPLQVRVSGTTADAVPASTVDITANTVPVTTGSTTTLGDGTWMKMLPWAGTIPAGTYNVGATVSYGVGNTGTATPYVFEYQQLTIEGGENASTHLRRPVIAGTTEADPGTKVTVTIGATSVATTVEADMTWTVTWPDDLVFGTTYDVLAELGPGSTTCASDTQKLTVVNTAPVALDDAYSATEDTLLTVNATDGVLKNDTDVDGDPLTAIQLTAPTKGTLALNGNGSFTYMPNANVSGIDTFTYKVNDGTVDSATATVTITIAPVNDLPVANNDAYSTSEETPLTVPLPGVLSNDTDIDGDPLTAIKVTDPAKGTVTLNANGSLTYTPNADVTGTDSFTYRANDGTGDSNEATVTIAITPVNDPPVAVDDAYSTLEDTPVTITGPGILYNDTDVEGDPLTAILVTGPTKGTLSLNPDGSFTYSPSANAAGTDTFTYQANDGAANSNIATVTITIAPVNDPPVAVNDTYSTDEDVPLTIAAAGVLANDSDVESNPLTAIKLTDPSKGTVTLNADGSFTYTPNVDATGLDTFTYWANDGAANSNVATVTINIVPDNDPPVAVNDEYITPEDAPLTIPAAGVLLNDTDIDGTPLTAVKVTDPAHGTVSLNSNGSFTYTPNLNYNGIDTFTYQANDGIADSNVATVTITVTPVNDPPVAVNDTYITNEETPLTIAGPGVLLNDTDVDGDSLTAVKVTDPSKGAVTLNPDGSFTYTPNVDATGIDTFTYRANDGIADSNVATVTITILPVNDPPEAEDDSYSTRRNQSKTINAPGVLSNDSDVDGDPLTAIKVTDPAKGTVTLNANGSFTYTPNDGVTGTDSFTYRANDGTANSNVATVTITITSPPEPPANHAPVAVNDTYSTDQDEALVIAVPGVLANDSDSDGDTLTTLNVTGPAHGTLNLNSNGSFTYTPNPGFSGTDSFTYRVSDGEDVSNVATVTITVIPSPDPPTIEGTVISAATNQPIAGATVRVKADFDGNGTTDFTWSGVTGADGKYRLQVERRDWTYTAEVTAPIVTATGTVSVTATHQTEVRPWHSGVFQAEQKIAGQILIMPVGGMQPLPPSSVIPAEQIAGVLLKADGTISDRPVTVRPDGLFEVGAVPAGQYRTLLQIVGSGAAKLAGSFTQASVTGPGQLVLGATLIDPHGQVFDAVSLLPVRDVTVTLYWADTKLNRDQGRVPDTPVALPSLSSFDPGHNGMPMAITSGGLYAWFVYPNGDYYVKAESYRYLPYDSRVEGRDTIAQAGQDNYVTDGVIHVGNSPLQYDFIMEPIHRRFIVGYPDGTFKPERWISRAEVAAILARNTEPAAVTLPLPPFPDVPATHWAATYIELVRQKGFMAADANGNFRPDQPITREELASAIARFKELMPSSSTAFPDIKGHWAENEINAMYEAHLIKGYPDGTFRPDASTRRDEAATMFNRALGRGPLSGRPYATWPDVPLDNWASQQVEESSNSHSAVRDETTGGERWTGDTGETTW